MHCLRRIFPSLSFAHWLAFLMYQHHCQMTHTHLALRQWLNSFRRSLNSSSGSPASKYTSENPHFSKQCFIVSLVIGSNVWFTYPIQCRRSTPWIISDAFLQSSILEITCFKSCLRYLTLKFWMILASQGCNWEVVFLGKNTSLMFLRFPWMISEWDGTLSRNSKTFRFLTSSLQSRAVRTWIMISVVIHAFLLTQYFLLFCFCFFWLTQYLQEL